MPEFSEAERRMLSYFNKTRDFYYEGQRWNVVNSGKPTCSSGEPKTDIYVLIERNSCYKEIKISYKKENADFIENKTNSDRAEQILGPQWRSIIEEATLSIRDKFESRPVIYKDKIGRTERGAITLGWKFELMNKLCGELSGRLNLTPQQVHDVYAGNNLSDDKRNSRVNGKLIENSGVADYILITDSACSAQDILEKMIPIDKYIDEHPDIYFACKALNYRTFAKKYDGDRPLSVQVDWKINDNGKLSHSLVFDSPLELNGNAVAERLLNCLQQLQIETTDDINDNNAE